MQTGYLTDLNWCTHVLQNKRFVSASYSSQSNCFNHCGWNTREFDAEPEPELVLHFSGRADQTRQSSKTQNRLFAFLRYAASEKRTLWHFITEWRNTEIVLARKFENVWSLIKIIKPFIKRKIHCLNILENQTENQLPLCDNRSNLS